MIGNQYHQYVESTSEGFIIKTVNIQMQFYDVVHFIVKTR
jgi:hypothetical protein